MILIGMLDSPFVRRVAVSMRLLGIDFEHRSWSVGKDFDKIQAYNPLGRVPTLVLDDGDSLIESAAILDYLDERVGPDHALLPPSGDARRRSLKLMAIAIGACEKGVLQLYERVFRPAEKHHEPWLERCRIQMHAALAELEKAAVARGVGGGAWLVEDRLTQADITTVCAFTFICDALAIDATAYPTLATLAERCEAMPAFADLRLGFDAPVAKS